MAEKRKGKSEPLTYESSGVSIDAGDKAVNLIRAMVQSTYHEGVVGDIGGFAGFFKGTFEDVQEPLLVSGTDGVGTKLMLAIKSGIVNTVGIDLVAMCANDILCTGARPLFFLDYYACGKNIPERTAEVISGIAEGCRQAGAALIGGEIAEMPDMYSETDFDLAGFCVGVVDKSKVIDGSSIEPGDILIGLPSSGLHSNGFSLVRKILDSKGISIDDEIEELPGKLIEHLLSPTRIYAELVNAVMETTKLKGIIHITGGGLTENIPRVMPVGCGVELNRARWEVPQIFKKLQEWGNVDTEEMHRVFNMGIGMVLVVDPNEVTTSLNAIEGAGETAFIIGKVIEGRGDTEYIG